MPKFDKAAKLANNIYNWRGWPILLILLNEWVAEGVASDVKDLTPQFRMNENV